MLTRSIAVFAPLLALVACSSDLFHSTAWTSRCENEPHSLGCPSASAGGGGAASSTTGSTSSATASSTTGGGGNGAGGGGGAGGSCATCLQRTQGSTDPFCNGSQAIFDALLACVCMLCPTECTGPCANNTLPDATCQSCAVSKCQSEANACASDPGG